MVIIEKHCINAGYKFSIEISGFVSPMCAGAGDTPILRLSVVMFEGNTELLLKFILIILFSLSRFLILVIPFKDDNLIFTN